jgi:hypothetical protein
MLYLKNNSVVTLTTCLLALILGFSTSTAQPTYEGTLRIYIVEETSRWSDAYGTAFTNGFLDWALVEEIAATDAAPFVFDTVWDASEAGFTNISMPNITVIAALFNDSCEMRDSYPPYERYFEMCPVDAVAAAGVGYEATSSHEGDCSHTVLAEIGLNTS